MAKKNFSPALLATQFPAIESEGRYPGNNHQEVVQILIRCSCQQVVHRAIKIIQRDLGTHLIDLQCSSSVVCAKLRCLELFCPSESLYFYHYHLQTTLGHRAQVWLSTQGGKL